MTQPYSNLRGFDYVEFYTGNARQAEHFYCTTFGFTPVAYAGLETGVRDRVSYVIQHRNIRIVLTSALDPASPINDHVKRHGDGIKDIAFKVDDAVHLFEQSIARGARPILEPTTFEDENGRVIKATVGAFGDTVHSFIQREKYEGAFLPGYSAFNSRAPSRNGFAAIDHIAISVEEGHLDRWIEFYKNVFDFHQSHQEDVATEFSAMNSKVVQSRNGRIRFPMMEPAPGKRKSQIQDYLNSYGGPGAQHMALLSDNIVESVGKLRKNGVEFLRTPGTYYSALEKRVGSIEEDIGALRQNNILVDRDDHGYLMQIFSKPLQGRPTVFFEVIQRKGAIGFGSGNIRALFEAIEREQAMRTSA